jgi:hypothetical protein
MKQRWVEAAFPLQPDHNIINKFKAVYKVFTQQQKNHNRLSENRKQEVVDNWAKTTVDLAVKDWEAAIRADNVPSSQENTDKIAVLEDYIGHSSTR